MTVIAFKDGVMAADSLAITGGLKHACAFPKIIRLEDGGLMGAAGCDDDIWAAYEWFRSGRPEKLPEFGKVDELDILWARADGSLWRPGSGVSRWFPVLSLNAIGSAWETAEIAMRLGHSAEGAVQVCIDLCAGIGGPIQVERVGNV